MKQVHCNFFETDDFSWLIFDSTSALTYWVSDCHDDRVPGVLDEVDDVAVVEGVDVHVVHRQDPVTHLQPPAPLGGRTWRENIFINTVNIFTIFYLLDTDQE